MAQNRKLQKFYERIYKKGEDSYFTKFESGKDKSENEQIVLKHLGNINGKFVIDVGCGTGSLSYKIAEAGAGKSVGIDYSPTAIETANNLHQHANLSFLNIDFKDLEVKADVIVSCGTFEHLDNPRDMMQKMSAMLSHQGTLILTCPHFYNIRGITWISLQKLLNVPMSLTDVHSISPTDMIKWSIQSGLTLVATESFDYDRANGMWMIHDMKKRLTNALRDAGLSQSGVDSFLSWAEDYIQYNQHSLNPNQFDGANCLYKFTKI